MLRELIRMAINKLLLWNYYTKLYSLLNMYGCYGFMVLHTYTRTCLNMDGVVLLMYTLNGSAVRHKNFTKPVYSDKHIMILTANITRTSFFLGRII